MLDSPALATKKVNTIKQMLENYSFPESRNAVITANAAVMGVKALASFPEACHFSCRFM